jgi:hypothetical protein
VNQRKELSHTELGFKKLEVQSQHTNLDTRTCIYMYIIYIERESGYTVSLSLRRFSVNLTQKIYQIIFKFEFFILIKFFILKSYKVQKFGMFRDF